MQILNVIGLYAIVSRKKYYLSTVISLEKQNCPSKENWMTCF
jgi:hypothetical protein